MTDSKNPETKQMTMNIINGLNLVNSFIQFGHISAKTNPLCDVIFLPELTLAFHSLGSDNELWINELGCQIDSPIKAEVLLSRLIATWCGAISIETSHMEPDSAKIARAAFLEYKYLTIDETTQDSLLIQLASCEALEETFGLRFSSVKRFGIEGSENILSVFTGIMVNVPDVGIKKVLIGSPHRGRFNILCHVVGMSAAELFVAFSDQLQDTPKGLGDVNVHIGFDGRYPLDDKIAVSMLWNPSHLEAVTPVTLGMVRALRDTGTSTLGVLVHGDAAFCGQGVVSEVLQMQKLEAFEVSGAIHIIVDNQLGFTTNPEAGRSGRFASSPGRACDTPIIRVNGLDCEACFRAGKLALFLREKLQSDVIVHVQAWRTNGHNEGDDPIYTQPLLYNKIEKLPNAYKQYCDVLKERGNLESGDAETLYQSALENFKTIEADIKALQTTAYNTLPVVMPTCAKTVVDTRVRTDDLLKIAEHLYFKQPNTHEKIQRILDEQLSDLRAGSLTFAVGEALAYGSLLCQGKNIRLSGQDSARGTFAQRHAIVVDQKTGVRNSRFSTLGPGKFQVYDSLLSEYAALSFEYGYDVEARGNTLVLWEAQFGDFANGAQITIDTCISNGESKWEYPSGLVLLLPHGAEGQGPEHSSARVERFLQLATPGALRLSCPSTGAQIFHLLRAQALESPRCPLIIFTPKSQLRAIGSRSAVSELSEGRWQSLLVTNKNSEVRKTILCYSKLGANIVEAAAASNIKDIQIIRIEDLYPLPIIELCELLEASKTGGLPIVWCQEEMSNCGPGNFILGELAKVGFSVEVICSGNGASNAPGSSRWAKLINEDLIKRVLL
jgi:2-oxoglutarate decarboxylase